MNDKADDSVIPVVSQGISTRFSRFRGTLTVTLDERGDEAGLQELLRLLRNGSPSVDGVGEVSSRRLLDRFEHHSVEDLRDGVVRSESRLDREGKVEHRLLEGSSTADLAHDSLSDQFPDRGNSTHNCGLEGAHVSYAVADGRVGEGLLAERWSARAPRDG